MCGRAQGGLIAPVLKPMGQPPEAFAALAAGCVRGGADIVKEDHGLAGQPSAPFRARVAADGTVRDDFLAELVLGLNSTVTTKLQKFTITGNAQTRDLELAWPASACVWKLKPRG